MKQLCSALGVDVIATGGSDEKLEVVKQQALGKGRSDSSALYIIPMFSFQSYCHTQLQQRREADCSSEDGCKEVKLERFK